MFRRRSHLSHLCKWWKTYRGYWPFNNEHDLLNINHKLYQRVSSFFDNEHKRTTSALHYKINDFLPYQLIIITIILQIIIKLPGVANAGELRLNPNINRTIQHAGPDHSFFISCLPFSDEAQGISDSRFRAKELSWKKLRKVPVAEWVVMGSASHQRVYVESSSDGRGLDLIFRSLKESDEGEYACTATLDGRKEHRNVSLGIIDPISFSKTPKVQTTQEGSKSKTIICRVTGNPKPTISWRVGKRTLWPDKSSTDSSTEKTVNDLANLSQNKKYHVTETGDLVIQNITKEDRGNYKCKATQLENGFTDFGARVIQLKVEHKPEWSSTMERNRKEFYGFISGTANLTCEVEAEPPAEFTWYRVNPESGNNKMHTIAPGTFEKDNTSDEKISSISYPSAQIVNKNGKSTLMLPMTHDTLFGEYRCKANNSMGSISRKVHLVEGAKPGIPKLITQQVHSENATFMIKKNQAELVLEITGFQLEYKEELQDWKDATRKNVEKNPSGIYLIERLKPLKIYLVRARSRNLAGLSEPSNIVYLQTNRTFKPLGRGGRGYPYQVEDLKGSVEATRPFSNNKMLLTSICCLLSSFPRYLFSNVWNPIA